MSLTEKISFSTKFVLTCSFQKMIRTLAFRGRGKFDNIILFHNSWYSLIDSSISFNLIPGFRYLQFKAGALHRLDARHL